VKRAKILFENYDEYEGQVKHSCLNGVGVYKSAQYSEKFKKLGKFAQLRKPMEEEFSSQIESDLPLVAKKAVKYENNSHHEEESESIQQLKEIDESKVQNKKIKLKIKRTETMKKKTLVVDAWR
jgi:cell division protein FtsX